MWNVPFFGINEERAEISKQSKGKTSVTSLDVSLSSTFRSQPFLKRKKIKICKGQMHKGGRFSPAFYVSFNKCCFSGQDSVSTGVLRSKNHLWQLITYFDFQHLTRAFPVSPQNTVHRGEQSVEINPAFCKHFQINNAQAPFNTFNKYTL